MADQRDASLQLGGMWQQIDSDNDATASLTITGLNPPRGAPTRGDLTSFHPLPQIFEKDQLAASLSAQGKQEQESKGPSLPIVQYAGRYRDAWYGSADGSIAGRFADRRLQL